MLPIWGIIVGFNWTVFFYPYLICYHMPLWLFYVLGELQAGEIIHWSWYMICVPLYPMIILVPASLLLAKRLNTPHP